MNLSLNVEYTFNNLLLEILNSMTNKSNKSKKLMSDRNTGH